MKTTTITGPDGQTITVREENRGGCLRWVTLIVTLLFLVGLLIVYPWLLIPTVLIIIAVAAHLIHTRRSFKP